MVLLLVLVGGGILVYARGSAVPLPRLYTSPDVLIKIGADLPLMGMDEITGQAAENGMRLAINEANAAHFLPGYRFVLDPYNDIPPSGEHGGFALGAENVTAMIGDAQVAGIIGPLNSSVALSEMAIANQAPIVMISPANSHTCLTQNTPASGCTGNEDYLPVLRPSGKVTYFRVAPVDSWQGVFAAEFASSSQSYHTAYVLDDTTLYSMLLTRHFTQEFRKYGGHILGYDSLRPMTDYTQELTKIAALHPDMIYFGGLDSTGGIALYKQMASIPGLTHTPSIGGDGILTDAFARAVGTPHGPVYSTLGTVDVTRIPSMAGFVNTYQAAYGPLSISTNYPYGGLYSAYSYDSAKILLNAIKTAVTTGFQVPTTGGAAKAATIFRQAVIDAVAKTDYDGVLGHQSFDANGDTTNNSISLYQFTNVNGSPAWQYLTTQAVPVPPGWKYDLMTTRL